MKRNSSTAKICQFVCLGILTMIFVGVNSFWTMPASQRYADPRLIPNIEFENICAKVQNDEDNSLSIRLTAIWVNSMAPNQNLFQTASLNDGLRIELDRKGIPSLIVSPSLGVLGSISADLPLLVGQPKSIFLKWDKRSNFSLVIGQSTRSSTWNFKRNIRCNDFKIGIGYDSSRVFEGRIKNLQIEFGYRVPLLKVNPAVKFMFGALFGFAVLFILRRKN